MLTIHILKYSNMKTVCVYMLFYTDNLMPVTRTFNVKNLRKNQLCSPPNDKSKTRICRQPFQQKAAFHSDSELLVLNIQFLHNFHWSN